MLKKRLQAAALPQYLPTVQKHWKKKKLEFAALGEEEEQPTAYDRNSNRLQINLCSSFVAIRLETFLKIPPPLSIMARVLVWLL